MGDKIDVPSVRVDDNNYNDVSENIIPCVKDGKLSITEKTTLYHMKKEVRTDENEKRIIENEIMIDSADNEVKVEGAIEKEALIDSVEATGNEISEVVISAFSADVEGTESSCAARRKKVDTEEELNEFQPHSSPRIIITNPETKEIEVTDECFSDTKKKEKQRQLLTYTPRRSSSNDDTESTSTTQRPFANSPSQRPKNRTYTYDNPNYLDFKDSTKDYFQFLNRYHIGDTLSIFSRDKLQFDVRKFGIDHINIGLFGQPGSGKSALYNSMYYAMTGDYKEFSAERKTNTSVGINSITDRRLELRLTETIFLLDNRGINFSTASFKEVVKQCEGFREAEETVPENWNSSFKQKFKDGFSSCCKRQLFRNRVQCPIIVSSLMQDFQFDNMKKLTRLINSACGCNPVIVLTHIDEIQEKGEEILNKRKREFEEIHCARIFPLSNYTYKQHDVRNADTDEKIVEALFNCCLVADQAIRTLIGKIEKVSC